MVVGAIRCLGAGACIMLLGCPTEQRWVEPQRQQEVLSRVRTEMTTADVNNIGGEPSFVDEPLTEPFFPEDQQCRNSSTKALIYQTRKGKTVVVYAGAAGNVTCVEQTRAFRLIHR
jgi:hypothetical protein